ncbi:hypothetical protein [Nereida sp. NH-UV-3]
MKLYIRGTLATERQKEMAKPPTKKIRQKNSGDTREDGIAAF